MHLLVTRPEADAKELITLLEQAGHKVSHFPLLEIQYRLQVALPDNHFQAVLITSANGARAFGGHNQKKAFAECLAITVGPASAKAARDAGFSNVVEACRGDVIGVIDYVRGNLNPQDGGLLYASGAMTRGDLVGELSASGFSVERAVLYEACPVTKMPENFCNFSEVDKLDGVLLFSPRTAKIWLSVTKGCFSTAEMAKMKHYCLSENVAKIIDQGLGNFSDIIICEKPDVQSMLQVLSKNHN